MKKLITLLSVLALGLAATPVFAQGQSDLAEARHATSAFHKVSHAEAAGYESTLNSLGCFENPGVGGMGVHYLNEGILDGTPEADSPEALVYEMRSNGKLKLVGLEYIVPIDAWTETEPPTLYGREFHQHPVLPLWVLHAWVWTPNPMGMFADWNPRVGMCADDAPIFGVDLP